MIPMAFLLEVPVKYHTEISSFYFFTEEVKKLCATQFNNIFFLD